MPGHQLKNTRILQVQRPTRVLGAKRHSPHLHHTVKMYLFIAKQNTDVNYHQAQLFPV